MEQAPGSSRTGTLNFAPHMTGFLVLPSDLLALALLLHALAHRHSLRACTGARRDSSRRIHFLHSDLTRASTAAACPLMGPAKCCSLLAIALNGHSPLRATYVFSHSCRKILFDTHDFAARRPQAYRYGKVVCVRVGVCVCG